MKIQSSLFQVHNRKKLTWKLILCVFEHCVLLNFKASAAETGIYHSLEIVFLESTVHRLSVDTLLFYSCINKQSMKIQSRLFQVRHRKDVKVNITRFRTLRSIEFQGLCSRNLDLLRSENCIFTIYGTYGLSQCLSRVSKDSPWRYKAVYSRCIIEKDWRES